MACQPLYGKDDVCKPSVHRHLRYSSWSRRQDAYAGSCPSHKKTRLFYLKVCRGIEPQCAITLVKDTNQSDHAPATTKWRKLGWCRRVDLCMYMNVWYCYCNFVDLQHGFEFVDLQHGFEFVDLQHGFETFGTWLPVTVYNI